MLSVRTRLAVGLVILCLVPLPKAATAAANPVIPPKPGPNYTLRCVAAEDVCFWVLTTTVSGEGTEKVEETQPVGSKTKTKPVCTFNGGSVPCIDEELGNWSNSQQCYLHLMVPPPPADDPVWQGRTDGAVWACVREQGYHLGRHLVTKLIWMPGEPDTVVTDPVTLAYRAIAEMKLSAPNINSAPGAGQIGLVNMPVWLWAEKTENTWGPIVRSAEVPGLEVTATAKVKAIRWSMGDGNTIRCTTAGTPYQKAFGTKDSPDCGHRYKKTSREQPDCKYPVTATTDWDITWQSTLGDSGQIPWTEQVNTQLRIGEAVPVLVDPANSEPDPAPSAVEGC